jgi:hypothetical protein
LQDLSIEYSSSRLEWRPSLVGAALMFFAFVAAGAALGLSRLGGGFGEGWAGGCFLLVGVCVGAFFAARHWRVSRLTVFLLANSDARLITGSGKLLAEGRASLHEQWPVLVLRFTSWTHAVVFWPDTLSPCGRRQLRLWARAAPPASALPLHWTG